MKRPEINGWEVTTNENGIKMATLPRDTMEEILKYIEYADKQLRIHDVICSPQRVNVFDAKGKLIGQDYQRDNGDWMHKWIDPKTGTFERGSWRGRCKGEDMQNWSYEDCI